MPRTRSQKRAMDQSAARSPSSIENLSVAADEAVESVLDDYDDDNGSNRRRITRSSLSHQHDTTDQKKRRTASQPRRATKKARASVPTRTYNLRSSQHPVQKTVTPGTVPRRGPPSRSSSEADEDKYSEYGKQAALPMGVVDIFAARPSYCGKKSRKPGSCCCPPVTATETIQILSSQHVTDYGQEYFWHLAGCEEDQLVHNLGRIHGIFPTTNESPDHCSQSRQDTDSSEDEDDSSIEDQVPRRARRTLAMGRGTPSPANSMDDTDPLPLQPLLTARMRKVLVQWLSEVVVEFRLGDATYHLAVSLLDQLLTMGPSENQYLAFADNKHGGYVTEDEEECPWFLIRRKDFQAVGCVCLWLAAKIEEIFPPRNEKFVYISDYSFTSDKLNCLETRVCKLLQYRLQRVTPFHFVHLHLRASVACRAPACPHFLDRTVLQEMLFYLIELSRSSYVLSLRQPSLLVAASLYLARVTLGLRAPVGQTVEGNDYWTRTLQHYTGYTVADLSTTVLVIHQWQLAAESSPAGVNPVFTKFGTDSRLKVSLKTVPRVEDLGLLGVNRTHNDDLDVNDNRQVTVHSTAL